MKKELKKLAEKFQAAGLKKEASRVNELIKNGSVTLGLSDEDWNVDIALDDLGLVGTPNKTDVFDTSGTHNTYRI
jgi:hypothetical protein